MPAGPTIRVLVVDADGAARAGLRAALDARPGLETVGEAASAELAVFEAGPARPDVLLLGVAVPVRGGIAGVPALLDAVPGARLLVRSPHDDARSVREAFAAGASGYALAEDDDAELAGAVRAVAAGERYVHPRLGARVIADDAAAAARAAADPLSDREREVLRLLALGHTNREIAGRLVISVRTAETHRANIMQKLRLSSRAELVRHAIAAGMLDGSGPPPV